MEIMTRSFSAFCRPERRMMTDGLERAFLSDMMKHAGPGPLEGSFGGGAGEEQFSSLLSDLNSEALARRLDLKLFSVEEMASCPYLKI